MNNPDRNRHLAHIHAACKAVGLDGDRYRAFLKRRTGRESCDDLTDAEVTALSDSLKGTDKQFRLVYALALEVGYTGLDDPGFLTFCKKITKETEPRLLSKMQLGNLITGLKNWAEYKRNHPTAEGAGAARGPDPR